MTLDKIALKDYLQLKKKIRNETLQIWMGWLLFVGIILSYYFLPELIVPMMIGIGIVLTMLLYRGTTKQLVNLLDKLIKSEPDNLQTLLKLQDRCSD